MNKLKYISSLFGISFVLFSFSNCGGAQTNNTKISLEQNPPFNIANAYYQDWVAGVRDGGSGTNIYITFTDMEKGVTIQNIYFRNEILETNRTAQDPKMYVGYLKNDDKSDFVMDSDPMKEAQNTPSKQFPFQLSENEAVVAYLFSGQKNYYKISPLAKKDMIAYPQSNIHE